MACRYTRTHVLNEEVHMHILKRCVAHKYNQTVYITHFKENPLYFNECRQGHVCLRVERRRSFLEIGLSCLMFTNE